MDGLYVQVRLSRLRMHQMNHPRRDDARVRLNSRACGCLTAGLWRPRERVPLR